MRNEGRMREKWRGRPGILRFKTKSKQKQQMDKQTNKQKTN